MSERTSRRDGRRRAAAIATLVGALALVAAVGPSTTAARASQLLDRDATHVRLEVDAKGEALVTYTAHGSVHHVLVWGAINALAPTRSAAQVAFHLDYSGGWGEYHDGNYWKAFRNVCRPYQGPALAFEVAACTAPNGSNWALQSWDVSAPDLGFVPWSSTLAASSLDISHWSGPLAQLQVYGGWVYREHYHRLFGKLTYLGQPVFGFGSTRFGVSTDAYGRLIYVDTLDAAAYGPGWRRENSFLTHSPTGTFCYGFYPHNPLGGGYTAPPGYDGGERGPGVGTLYRLSVIGPGVTPDISVTIPDPGGFNATTQKAMRAQLLALGRDAACDAH